VKKGDLVRVINPVSLRGIKVGDLAILVDIDWDHHEHPNGIRNAPGRHITGRGWFFFPDRPEVHRRFRSAREGPPSVMLIFDDFEVISEPG
jgi:hypothetical protein